MRCWTPAGFQLTGPYRHTIVTDGIYRVVSLAETFLGTFTWMSRRRLGFKTRLVAYS